MNIARLREIFRGKGKGNYKISEYKKLIKIHIFTLNKYLTQFKVYAQVYIDYKAWYKQNKPYFGERKFPKPDKKIIKYLKDRKLNGKIPHIRDIFELLKFDIKNNNIFQKHFLNYCTIKTHLSYDLYYKPKPVKQTKFKGEKDFKDYLEHRDDIEGNLDKLGEFVYFIITEYTILHNWIWCSGLKLKQIRTIDKWTKNID